MVHQYKLNGYNIVIDSESASVHAVDDIAYDIISKYENNSRDDVIRSVMSSYPEIGADEISECYDQVTELRKQGKLFADRIEKTVKTKRRADPPVKALCLHVAHTCNLNCSYCFASQGKYHGERALMSLETGKRALDFLIENSGTRRNLEVDFFGGEPLLNFGMIKELTEGDGTSGSPLSVDVVVTVHQ